MSELRLEHISLLKYVQVTLMYSNVWKSLNSAIIYTEIPLHNKCSRLTSEVWVSMQSYIGLNVWYVILMIYVMGTTAGVVHQTIYVKFQPVHIKNILNISNMNIYCHGKMELLIDKSRLQNNCRNNCNIYIVYVHIY